MSWMIENSLWWHQKLAMNVLKCGPVPNHIAIIMDGNRRYATKEHVDKLEGHSKGFDKLSETLLWCREMGVSEVTVYAFSIENFKRSPEEVETLMNLACEKYERLLDEREKLHENGVCIRLLGNLSLIPPKLRTLIAKAMILTKDNRRSFLNVAFAYTSRDEITESIDVIREGVCNDEISIDDIDRELLSECMYSHACSEPDILIRTSGEVRFSDFLLWQSHSSNVIFHKVLWPDFSVWHFLTCIFYYQRHEKDQNAVRERLKSNFEMVSNRRKTEFIENVHRKRYDQLQLYANA